MRRFLLINGEKKRVPRFPHHKDYIYRTRHFLEKRSPLAIIFNHGLMPAFRLFANRWRYKYAIPTTMLIDPANACNMHCHGCWAKDYDKTSRLSYEKLDEILTDARKLGIVNILMTGGEPLMRKDEILQLCRKHNKLTFALFTNGTLIDEKLASEMALLGNLNMLISIEGFAVANDFRRGAGAFGRAVAAMDILRQHDIGFGFSICYHAKNYREVCSDEFLDFLRKKGAWFGWMFIYLPLGQHADMSLCLNAGERAFIKQKIESYSQENQFTILDFANQGHLLYGCVGAGNGFIHINSNGDLEPCAFFHYSDVNLNDMPLRKALASPFFRRFRRAGPFTDNHSRPCPMIDAPEVLQHLSEQPGVKSTHLSDPETMQQLASKTKALASDWKPKADELYARLPEAERKRIEICTKTLRYRY